MDILQRQQILNELLRRLGTEEQFERVAARAGVPNIVVPGQNMARRYEQLIARLWDDSPEALLAYLEAAAIDANGGFEMRFSLREQTATGWPQSKIRTTTIQVPPDVPPDLPPDATAPPEFAQMSTTLVRLPEALEAVGASARASAPLPPPIAAIVPPEEEATTVTRPRSASNQPPSEAQQLEALHHNYERRGRTDSTPPVADFEHTMGLPSLAQRLKSAGEKADLEQEVLDHVRGEPQAPLVLQDARLVSGDGPGGRYAVLKLLGLGFQAPLLLELEGLTGRRRIERVQGNEARALISERNWLSLMPRRVRIAHRALSSEWVDVRMGSRADMGAAWPALREDAGYVPAGEYRLPSEQGVRRLEAGVQLGLLPVTNRQFYAFVTETGYKPDNDAEFLKHLDPKLLDEAGWQQPVLFVNEADAAAYCNWVGGRLPSAEAWERAALGFGTHSYPWGDDYDLERMNTREARHGWVTPVERFPRGAGPYGHLDLAGNVWEWTSSPGGDDRHRVLKGGSWVNDRRCAALGFRAAHRPELRTFYIGFRVAWPVPEGWPG